MNMDGGILVAELASEIDAEHNAQTYFKNLFNSIEVEAHVNTDGFGTTVSSPAPPIRGNIGLVGDFFNDILQNLVCFLGLESG